MTLSRESEDNPFAPIPVPENNLQYGVTFQRVESNGQIGEYKYESGILVKIRNLGSFKTQVKTAIYNAALDKSRTKSPEELLKLSHMEVAAYRLAHAASDGDLQAVDMLFDRLIGKPKQSTESVRINLNIDEFLTRDDSKEIKDVDYEVEDE